MHENGEKLAFIVGHYKSGSTWLVNLLSLHPEIRGVSETHVFRYSEEGADLDHCVRQLFGTVAWAGGGAGNLARHRAAAWTRPLRKALGLARGQAALSAGERPTTALDLALADRAALRRKLRACTGGDPLCRAFFAFLVEKLRPGRYLVEKTPTNMPYVPRIRRLYPASKLIAVYRDGRDVVVSDKYHLARAYRTTRTFEDRVGRWRKAMEDQIRHESEHGVHTISYESMLETPRVIVAELLRFLGLPTSDELLEDMIRRSSFEFVTGRKRGEGDRSAFYRKGIAGDWRNHYTDEEKKAFSGLAGDLLVRLGYEESADWRSWG